MVIWHCSHLAVSTYICQLNCHVRVWHGKTRDFIIDGTIYWVRLFEVSVFERKEFFLLRNIGEIDRTFKSVRAIHGIRPIRHDPSSRHRCLTVCHKIRIVRKIHCWKEICGNQTTYDIRPSLHVYNIRKRLMNIVYRCQTTNSPIRA